MSKKSRQFKNRCLNMANALKSHFLTCLDRVSQFHHLFKVSPDNTRLISAELIINFKSKYIYLKVTMLGLTRQTQTQNGHKLDKFYF
jgi:hypothetical protein